MKIYLLQNNTYVSTYLLHNPKSLLFFALSTYLGNYLPTYLCKNDSVILSFETGYLNN